MTGRRVVEDPDPAEVQALMAAYEELPAPVIRLPLPPAEPEQVAARLAGRADELARYAEESARDLAAAERRAQARYRALLDELAALHVRLDELMADLAGGWPA